MNYRFVFHGPHQRSVELSNPLIRKTSLSLSLSFPPSYQSHLVSFVVPSGCAAVQGLRSLSRQVLFRATSCSVRAKLRRREQPRSLHMQPDFTHNELAFSRVNFQALHLASCVLTSHDSAPFCLVCDKVLARFHATTQTVSKQKTSRSTGLRTGQLNSLRRKWTIMRESGWRRRGGRRHWNLESRRFSISEVNWKTSWILEHITAVRRGLCRGPGVLFWIK